MQVCSFPVIPRIIGPLVIGGILHRFSRQRYVRLIFRIGISARQQASTQRIRIVDLLVEHRDITYTNRITFLEGDEVAKDMLAGARRYLQVFLILKMIVAVQKRVADQRGPDNRWNPFGQIKAS